MNLLIDTHFVLAIVDGDLGEEYPGWAPILDSPTTQVIVSVASIWEIAIKTRLKKLDPRIRPHLIASHLAGLGIEVLDISAEHATAELKPDVPTRDPSDRLLLAQAQIEGLRFVTIDRALAEHPVTFRA